MNHEKNLLSIPSPLHSPASSRVLWAAVNHIEKIVADRHEQLFFTRNDSRYQSDISREVSGPAIGELIVGLPGFASDRWKLRKCALSTDVDKAVSNSNLNYDFRFAGLWDQGPA